MCFIVTL